MTERHPDPPVMFIFSGLPGSGKTTLARALAREVHACYVRLDTIEQAIRDLCGVDVEGEGYELGYRIASDNLRLGQHVVADSCNPIELTRREWERVATTAGARFVNIEVVCTDAAQHRSRVEARLADVPGLELPTWSEVARREYDRWTAPRLVVDTAGRSPLESQLELVRRLSEPRPRGRPA